MKENQSGGEGEFPVRGTIYWFFSYGWIQHNFWFFASLIDAHPAIILWEILDMIYTGKTV